jgi:hypothetical protein
MTQFSETTAFAGAIPPAWETLLRMRPVMVSMRYLCVCGREGGGGGKCKYNHIASLTNDTTTQELKNCDKW